MSFIEAEKRKRYADFVVEVALVFESIIFHAHYGVNHFFRCCFADTSRNTDYGDIEKASVIACKIKQSLPCAFYKNLSVTETAVSFAHNGACTKLNCLLSKLVTVKVFALDCDEQTAFFDFSCVRANGIKAAAKI